MATQSIITPDPSGAIHQSRLAQADASTLARGAELREHVAATDAIWTRAIALQDIDTPEARKEADALIRAGNERSGEYQRLLNEIRDTPAHTQAGMAEKAFAVLQWLSPGGEEIPDDHEDGRVAWSLAKDVLRVVGESRPGGANPDASLISDCEEMARLLKEANASAEDASRDEMARWEVLAGRIIAAPTHTSDGVLARVRALAAAHGDFGASFDYREGEPALMLAAIMHAVDPAVRVTPGVAGRADRPSPILARGDDGLRHENASSDAELIAACGRFDENELRLLRLCYGPTKVPDAEWEAASDAVVGMTGNDNPALPEILRFRATTMEGARALARSAVIEADNAFRRQIEGGEDAMCPTPLAVLAVSFAGFDAPGPEIEGGRL